MAKYKSNMRKNMRKAAQARAEKSKGGGTTLRLPDGYGDVKFFKVNKPKVMLDIIPYVVSDKRHPDADAGAEVGTLWPSRRYYVHRGVGAEENSYICPLKTFGKPCPICEYASARARQGGDREELKALRPRARDLYNVIDLDDPDKKIQLFDMSGFLFGDTLTKELIDASDDEQCFAELKGGYSLKLRFEKKSFNRNEFWAVDRIDFVERQKDYKESIIEETVPLDDILVEPDYKTLEKIFLMTEGGADEDDEEEEERPAKRRARDEEEEEEQPKRKRPSRDEEEEDEEDSKEPEEDEDEEEEAPKKPSKKRPAKDEEDEDEDEEDSDEEEEEQPKKRGRRKKAEPEEEEEPDEEDEEEEEAPKSKKGSCPYKHKFGTDCDKYEDCDECKKWGACNSAKSK